MNSLMIIFFLKLQSLIYLFICFFNSFPHFQAGLFLKWEKILFAKSDCCVDLEKSFRAKIFRIEHQFISGALGVDQS